MHEQSWIPETNVWGGGGVGGLWAGLVFEDSTILPSGTGLSVCVGGEDTDDNIASIKPNTQKS